MSKHEVEIDDLIFHFETRTYYCVSTEEDKFGDEADRIYLSRDNVTKEGDTFIMPEWYAESKGLL